MGLSYTGSNCLLMASVAGCSRVPEPPARMMPLRAVMIAPDSQNFGQHAVNALLPVRQLQAESLLQLAGVEARIQRPLCRGRVGAGRDRPDRVGRDLDRQAPGAGALDDVAGVTVPADLTTGNQ